MTKVDRSPQSGLDRVELLAECWLADGLDAQFGERSLARAMAAFVAERRRKVDGAVTGAAYALGQVATSAAATADRAAIARDARLQRGVVVAPNH